MVPFVFWAIERSNGFSHWDLVGMQILVFREIGQLSFFNCFSPILFLFGGCLSSYVIYLLSIDELSVSIWNIPIFLMSNPYSCVHLVVTLDLYTKKRKGIDTLDLVSNIHKRDFEKVMYNMQILNAAIMVKELIWSESQTWVLVFGSHGQQKTGASRYT